MDVYNECRASPDSLATPNEPEMAAYYVLFTAKDQQKGSMGLSLQRCMIACGQRRQSVTPLKVYVSLFAKGGRKCYSPEKKKVYACLFAKEAERHFPFATDYRVASLDVCYSRLFLGWLNHSLASCFTHSHPPTRPHPHTAPSDLSPIVKLSNAAKNTPLVKGALRMLSHVQLKNYEMAYRLALELPYLCLCAMHPWLNFYRGTVLTGTGIVPFSLLPWGMMGGWVGGGGGGGGGVGVGVGDLK